MKPQHVLIYSPEGVRKAKEELGESGAKRTLWKKLKSSVGRFNAKYDSMLAVSEKAHIAINLIISIIDSARDFFVASDKFTMHYLPKPPANQLTPYDTARVNRDQREMPQIKVGVWNLDAWLVGLSKLVKALNTAQSAFVFYEVEAAAPAGLISRRERMIPWLTEIRGEEPSEGEKREIQDNIISEDFFGLSESIRSELGLDFIVGVTPFMVAGRDHDGRFFYNYFSTFHGQSILSSCYQLHEFAQSTGRPFEAFLAVIITSQLLTAKFYPKLGFHSNTGCLFDFDENRVRLIDKVVDPRIDPDCMTEIDPDYRAAAQSFVDLIRSLSGGEK